METTQDGSLWIVGLTGGPNKIHSAVHSHVIGGATIFKKCFIIISFATGMQTKGNSCSGTNLKDLDMGTCLQEVTTPLLPELRGQSGGWSGHRRACEERWEGPPRRWEGSGGGWEGVLALLGKR